MAQTYFGAKMLCEPRDIVQSSIIHFGVWEPEISAVMERLIQARDVVVDMGANVGYHTLLMSKLVGPFGQVVAIEALSRLAKQVEKHAKINGVENVRVVNVAAAAETGRVTIYEAPVTNVGASSTQAKPGFASAGEVECLPLTSILTLQECKRLSFLKCDIEGAEGPVMAQLLDNLGLFSDRLSVQVETNTGTEWPVLFARFKAAGFRAFQFPNDIGEHWRNLLRGKEGIGPLEVTELPSGQADLLFTRSEMKDL